MVWSRKILFAAAVTLLVSGPALATSATEFIPHTLPLTMDPAAGLTGSLDIEQPATPSIQLAGFVNPSLIRRRGGEVEEASDEEIPFDYEAPVQVFMDPTFVAPLQAGTRKRQVKVTAFLSVPNSTEGVRVCRRMLKIRDRVLGYMFENPFTLTADGKLDLVGAAEGVKGAANSVLAKKVVQRAILLPGVVIPPKDPGPLAKHNLSLAMRCGDISLPPG